MTKNTLTESDLNQHAGGTGRWYSLGIPSARVHFTDGARTVWEKGGAYWLHDLIAIHVAFDPACSTVTAQPFQAWKLKVNLPAQSAVLTADDGNGNVFYREEIPYTDFPLERLTLWVEGDGFGNGPVRADGTNRDVIYLPCEH
jgi:hypothetical protein